MGELAALAAAVCWTFTSIFFSSASRKLGSLTVNRARLALAVLFLGVTHLILRGSPLPLDAGPERWFWLGFSGILGLVMGDFFLFQSYVLIGTRLGTLAMALSPMIGTLLAWIFLGERLNWNEIAGIGVTLAGVSIVVLERSNGIDVADRRRFVLGLLCGVGAAFGQSAGLVLSKIGLAGGYPAISGVVIRMIVATSVIWVMALFVRQASSTVRVVVENRRYLALIALGAFFGPTVGVWMSLVSVQAVYVGVASTLMALTPVIVLPVLKFGFNEYISRRAVLGTAIALAGVAMLFILG